MELIKRDDIDFGGYSLEAITIEKMSQEISLKLFYQVRVKVAEAIYNHAPTDTEIESIAIEFEDGKWKCLYDGRKIGYIDYTFCNFNEIETKPYNISCIFTPII